MKSQNYRITAPIHPGRISTGKLGGCKKSQTIQFISGNSLVELRGQSVRHIRVAGRVKTGFLNDGRKVRYVNGQMNTWEILE